MRIISSLIFIFLVPCILITKQINGQDTPESKTTYLLSGIHYLFPSYPSSLKQRISILRRSPGISHIPISAEIFGYYKASGSKLIGGIFHGSADQYSGYDNRLRIEYYHLSFSVLYFVIRPQLREHLFVRGDIGPAVMRVSTSDKGTEMLHMGWSIKCGFGYAFRINRVSILPAFHHSMLFMKNRIYRQNMVGMNLLF